MLLIISSCSQKNYPVKSDMPVESGKCFAKCIMQDQYETTYTSLPVYQGKYDETKDYLDKVVKVITPETTKWEKRKADRNCLSSDPDECLVWCLIKVPGKSKEYVIVTDTTATKNYELISHPIKKLVKAGGYTDWNQVVCDSDITPEFYKRVQDSLSEKGYDVGIEGSNGKIGPESKEAMMKFQRENVLPIGQLDIETLEALGISI